MTDLEQRIANLPLEKRALLEARLQALASMSTVGHDIPRRHSTAPAPLSPAQERLWLLAQLHPGQTTYNEASAYRFRGQLDVHALQASLSALVRRHEILRTTYHQRDDGPVQLIGQPQEVPLPIVDLTSTAENKRLVTAQERFVEVIEQPFDLTSDLIMRACLYRLADQDHILLVVRHHIATDNWSTRRFWSELRELYVAAAAGRPVLLPPLPVQYADYAIWQRGYLTGDTLERQLHYWREQLDGLPMLQLPADRPRPETPSFQGAGENFTIETVLADKLRILARQEATTLHTVLLAAYAVLLSRTAAQEDFAIGVPVAGRIRPELEPLIGFFVNTLVIRAKLEGNPSFRQLLRHMRETMLSALNHQDMPFEKLVEELKPARYLNHNPFFDTLFQFIDLPRAEYDFPGLMAAKVSVPSLHAKFDMECSLVRGSDRVTGQWRYATDLYQRTTIQGMIGHYQTLLAGIAADPDCAVGQLPLLTRTERTQISTLSTSSTASRSKKLVTQLFEAQVERTPDAVALVDHERALTYRQLNQRANRLARRLQELLVGPDVCVALYMNRTMETMISLLGILKAGGAYLPLDPLTPQARLQWMLHDAEAAYLILPGNRPETPAQAEVPILNYPALESEAAPLPDGNPDLALNDNHLIYVMYTSGSTGSPKGVAMRQGVLSNLVAWHLSHPILQEGARTLQFSALSFDVSFQEIFSTWCTGGELVLLDDAARQDPRALAAALEANGIERLFLPNIVLQQIAPIIAGDAGRYVLKTVVTAGEQLHISEDVRRMASGLADFKLHNQYGPTESHVVSSFVLAGDPDEWPDRPPIGRPLPGARFYILDKHLQLRPAGYPGELVLGGDVLARGYLHRPDLTQERFLPDPFAGKPDAIMYRTGDLVRWLPDGQLQFLGRIDDQVKIRGFRVEPGEVKAVLTRHPAVREAAVLAREHRPGDRQLVAYFVPVGHLPAVTGGELRTWLKNTLPDYMIPSAYVPMASWPLTSHGKIDRSALPPPQYEARLISTRFIAPRTPGEEAIASIWRDVLLLDEVGIHDNFFELGGHSLLAVQVISRLEQRLQSRLPLRTLFEYPTVAGIARAINIGAAPFNPDDTEEQDEFIV